MENTYAVGTFFSLSHYAVHKFRIPGESVCDKRSGRTTASIYCIINGTVDFSTPLGQLSAKSGDVLYIPRRQRYTAKWKGIPDIVFYGIDFAFDIKSEFGNIVGSTSVFDNYPLQVLSKDLFEDEQTAQACFSRLYEEYCNPHEMGLKAISDFYCFFTRVQSYLDKRVLSSPDSPVELATAYIEQHCGEDFYMEELARMCGFSPSRFYSLFREYTGLTPVEYKNTVRIRKSQKLLEAGKSLDEIAEVLGFSSAAYFRKVFESVTGMLPGVYKKNASGYGEKRILL